MNAPSHPGLPFVGNTLEIARDPLAMFSRLHQQYKRIVHIQIGGRNQYLVFQPEDVKHVLQENHRNYGRSPAILILKRFLGEGLITSDGDFWRQQRRLMQPAFHRQKIALLGETMVQETALWINELAGAPSAHRAASQSVNLSQAFMDVTMRIVCKTLFSTEAGDNLNGLSHALDTLNRLANKSVLSPIKWPTNWPMPRNIQYNRARARVDGLIYNIIRDRKQTGERRDDLLDMLMYAEDEEAGGAPNGKMSEQQLRDECVTLFTAGHETTAVAMAWITYLLARNPAVMDRLRAEVDAALPAGTLPDVATFRSMPYTLQVVQEGLRLYPPAWATSRMALADDRIGDFHIPKGHTVLVSPYLLHHDPTNWPDPDRFDPDRFAPGADKDRPAYAYLPFGGGPRQCIGNQFALLEMQILLALLTQRFNWQLTHNRLVRPKPLITLRPDRPVEMQLTKR